MSVEISIKCDTCKDTLEDGQKCHCNGCMEEVEIALKDEEDTNDELRSQVQDLESKVSELEEELRKTQLIIQTTKPE